MAESVELLTQAVYQLVQLYLRSFCPPSPSFTAPPLPPAGGAVEGRSSKEASGTTDHLQFTLFALHGIPSSWISRSVSFSPVGEHGEKPPEEMFSNLSKDLMTSCR